MRYNSRRSRPAIRSRMTGRSVEPPRREGQGLVLLMAQTVLCVAALAVVFTMQYVKPREYKILGEYYTEITREDGDKQDEVMRLLATPITAQQLQQWWEDWQPSKLAEVFAWADGQTAMGGEEPIFPRNASYRKVVVSVPAASPLPMDAVITSDYGERTHPISGAWDFHTGIDLAAAAGTKIYPVYAGGNCRWLQSKLWELCQAAAQRKPGDDILPLRSGTVQSRGRGDGGRCYRTGGQYWRVNRAAPAP